jgi:hypothetical protein
MQAEFGCNGADFPMLGMKPVANLSFSSAAIMGRSHEQRD